MQRNLCLRIWAGERRLLPTDNPLQAYRIRCLKGSGYLRIMSRAERKKLNTGQQSTIQRGEIATLSGKDTMMVEITEIKR